MAKPSASRIIAAGAIGNVLEWYDFAVYGYFAAAIGRSFFPSEDPVAQVLAAFGIFAVGFLMRPIGGALIGYIGDRFGRRAALTFSVAAMAIPTFLVGALPGYQVMGMAAPIVLTLLRMIQGLSVGANTRPRSCSWSNARPWDGAASSARWRAAARSAAFCWAPQQARFSPRRCRRRPWRPGAGAFRFWSGSLWASRASSCAAMSRKR